MKTYISIVLLITVLLSGCHYLDKDEDYHIAYYYVKAHEENVPISSVVIPVLESDHADTLSLETIIKKYLEGPDDSLLLNYYPNSTRLIGIEDNGKTLIITLSKECASLSPLAITLSGSCLAMTLFPYTEAEKITILAEGGFNNVAEPPVFDRNNIAGRNKDDFTSRSFV